MSVETQHETELQQDIRKIPPYAVILHNDDYNTFEFVIFVLREVFGYPEPKCQRLAIKAHQAGRTRVWEGPKEHAELKAEQVRAHGPDPLIVQFGKPRQRENVRPLVATIEPIE